MHCSIHLRIKTWLFVNNKQPNDKYSPGKKVDSQMNLKWNHQRAGFKILHSKLTTEKLTKTFINPILRLQRIITVDKPDMTAALGQF